MVGYRIRIEDEFIAIACRQKLLAAPGDGLRFGICAFGLPTFDILAALRFQFDDAAISGSIAKQHRFRGQPHFPYWPRGITYNL